MPETDDLFNEPVYTIGHAAEKLGVAVPTLRMYEQAGLILPHRTKTQRRLYSRNDIRRLVVIIDLIRTHRMNIESIKVLCSLMPCWKIIGCPTELRNKCEAYQDGSTTPCWLVANKCHVNKQNDCKHCTVYLSCPKTMQNPKAYLKKYIS